VTQIALAPRRRSREYFVAVALNWVFAVLAAALPLRRLIGAYDDNNWWRYQAAEWLINFGGGPVRRGLSGQILISVPGVSDKLAVTVLVGVLVVAVPIAYALLIGSVASVNGSIWPVLLWVIPGGVLLGLWQGKWLDLPEGVLLFATRKEHAFLLLLSCYALVVTGHRHRWARWSVLYGLALVPMALVHEALAFVYAVAGALIAVTAAAPDRRERVRAALMVLVPPGITVVASLPFASPDRDQLERMWAAIDPQTQTWLGDRLPGPFELMSYSLTEALQYAGGIVLNPRGASLWFVLAVYVLGWTWIALALVDRSPEARKYSAGVAVVMVLALFPLLPVAIDWGRFIVIAASSTVVVSLARQRMRPPTRDPAPISLLTVAIAAVLVGALAFVGIPEAGAPFGA